MTGEVFALLTAFFYGWSDLYIRSSLRRVRSETATLYTLIFNVAVLWVGVVFFLLFSGLPEINWLAVGIFAFTGLLGPTLGRQTIFASIGYIGASRATSFKGVMPVFTTILAIIFLGERPGWLDLLGIGVVVCGAILLSLEHTQGQEGAAAPGKPAAVLQVAEGSVLAAATPADKVSCRLTISKATFHLGILLALLSALAYATSNTMRKAALGVLPSALIGSVAASTTALLSVSLFLALRGRLRENLVDSVQEGRWPLFWGGATCSIAMLFGFMSLKLAPASIAVTLSGTESFFIMLISFITRRQDEILNPRLVTGAVLIVGGAAIIFLG